MTQRARETKMSNPNKPPLPIDRRDGSTKGEMGVTTVGNLFSRDHLTSNQKSRSGYDQIKWAEKGACQNAMCPDFMRPSCLCPGPNKTNKPVVCADWKD